ncbi:uncharacterized protein LOC128212226 [Mya arenaria]|uniref:uncharacterized protein LOC128212226 n=1 Tax=Mya arenaria TaxID=6604 RepID=UPI0022E0F57E|nr:uncharacterized protein LOC128212226 [Mya arenaria]
MADMTSPRRYLETGSGLRCESAWSPMPEHLINFRDKADEPPSPDVGVSRGGNEHICSTCDMTFKTRAQMIYHQAAFCIGKSLDEDSIPSPELDSPEPSLGLPAEATTLVEKSNKSRSSQPKKSTARAADDAIVDGGDIAGDGTAREKTDADATKPTQLPVWRKASNGTVPPHSFRTDSLASSALYVCLAHIRSERVPGTVIPVDGGATFVVDGEEFKGCEYDVITDPGEQLTWECCDVIGGIPRRAIKGGYDKNGLQLFISRVTAPDGTWWCGKYAPQEQQCSYAWDGGVYTSNDIEFLCLKPEEINSEILET